MIQRKIEVSSTKHSRTFFTNIASILKNGRAKAVRFTTLDAICKALDCQPGDILEWEDDD